MLCRTSRHRKGTTKELARLCAIPIKLPKNLSKWWSVLRKYCERLGERLEAEASALRSKTQKALVIATRAFKFWRKAAGVEPTREWLTPSTRFEAWPHHRARLPSLEEMLIVRAVRHYPAQSGHFRTMNFRVPIEHRAAAHGHRAHGAYSPGGQSIR